MPHPSNAGLRSRKVDHKKPLAVYRQTDLADLEDATNITRTLHNISTGVEKEEEETNTQEHHLQAALHANSAGIQHAAVVIPTPDASRTFNEFTKYYQHDYVQPKSLIKFSAQLEECVGCPYNMDEKDDEWLASHKQACESGKHPASTALTMDEFEYMMWSMEQVADEKDCPQIEEIITFIQLEENPSFPPQKEAIPLLFEWWKSRRFQECMGNTIIPRLKTEEVGLTPDSDPYICFRKREIKALRKRGRADGQSIDKLNKLRLELHRAKQILELVLERESLRKKALRIEQDIFEQRVSVRRMKKKLGIADQEPSPDKMKKKLKRENYSLAKIKIPMQKFRDAANIMADADFRSQIEAGQLSPFLEALQLEEKAKKRCHADKNLGWIDTTEDPYQPYPSPSYANDIWSSELAQQTLSKSHDATHSSSPLNCGRKRVGRGGRTWIDQHYSLADIQAVFGREERDTGLFEQYLSKWQFCVGDNELGFEEQLPTKDISVSWRAFNLCATTDQECRSLINRPSFPEQINPTPTPLGQSKPEVVPPQVIKGPQSATNQPQSTSQQNKKKVHRPSNETVTKAPAAVSSSASLQVKKKQSTDPSLDPRAATIKAMMQQAQRQAQANASHNPSLQKSTMSTANSSPGLNQQIPGNVPTNIPNSSNSSPKQMMNTDTPKTSPRVSSDKQPPPINNKAQMTAQQASRMQQMRMQAPAPALIPGVPLPPQLANLSPQQLQQLYFNSQQQMMNAMATGAMHQAQAALQNRMRYSMGAGATPNPSMGMMGAGGQMHNNAQMAHLQAQLQQIQHMQQNNGQNVSSPLLALQQQLMSQKLQGGIPNAMAAAMAMSTNNDGMQMMNGFPPATKADSKKDQSDQK